MTSLVAFLMVLCASPPSPCEPLRNAIGDLSAQHGGQYPQAGAFLKRLDEIETRLRAGHGREPAIADLEALRREALLANPLLRSAPIVFVVRQQYRGDHHNTATFFPNALHEYNDGAFTPGGSLKMIDFAAGGQVRTLLDLPKGVLRDPDVHFSGRKILFSMRSSPEDSYHIYELEISGSVRQLTFAPDVDDLDPIYLPDDSIVFTSTREPKYCMCNRHIMANLHRMEADGANIHQIGKSTLFEGHPALLPDGRILYDRWEYVDRNFGDAQGLWTVYPDGTQHAVYWGNNTASPGAVLDARPIPGTQQVLCVFSSCHDRPWGALAIVDRRRGLDGRTPVVRTWPADATNRVSETGWEIFDAFVSLPVKYEDPYPLSEKYFLCSRMTGQGEQMGIYLVDVFGNEVLAHAEGPGCFDPMPLAPRMRPPVSPTRRDFENREGRFYVADVYLGTHMAGVERGAVKSLRVVESPEKRFWTRPAWNGQGQEAPAMNWHDFNNKRILGTVPVEKDGSAYFSVPSDTYVYFQLLDEKGMMIQSMRSGVIAQSGEVASCVGCHDERRAAPPMEKAGMPLALRRAPSRLDGWHGPARLFNYLAEVQPVFDRHCVRCHDFGQEAGTKLNLAGDRDLVFNASYNELWRKRQLVAVGAGPAETKPARSWGSSRSHLVEVLLQPHYDVQLSGEDFDRIATWIDLNAPYYPSYASAYPDGLGGRSPLDGSQLSRLEQITGVPLGGGAGHSSNRGPQVSFDRPELSPCLAGLTDHGDVRYREALAIITAGRERLLERSEADGPSFVPSAMDQWREQKYVARRQTEQLNREAIRKGERRYERE